MKSHPRYGSPVLTVLALLIAPQALATERVGPELCGNNVDDDGDGSTDEMACRLDASSSPTSGDGVIPEAWSDNPGCAAIGFGSLYSFKIDGTPTDGTYTFTDADGVMNGGPQDPNNSVTVAVTADQTGFSWDATLPIQAIIVKAQDANVYVYDPADFGDSGLATIGGRQISHVEFCYGYQLVLEKDATTDFTRTWDWTITKSVDDDELSGFAGETLHTGYTVAVVRTSTDSDHRVFGNITIGNPSPDPVGITVTDELAGGIPAVVSCPTDIVAPGGTVVCTYIASVPDGTTRLNTATVVSSNPWVPGGQATAQAVFGAPSVVGFPSVTVTDTQGDTTAPWVASGSTSWDYPTDFACPTDPAAYTEGVFHTQLHNTAAIPVIDESCTEVVDIACYLPLVSKTALTSYTREIDWTITKSADPTSHTGVMGDTFSSTYEVEVRRNVTESEFFVYGDILVHNPSPDEALDVSVSDSPAGAVATLSCGGVLSIPAGGSAACSYSATLDQKIDGTNAATVSANGVSVEALAAWSFGEPNAVIGFEEVDVVDSSGPQWTGANGDATWTYDREFNCPTEAVMYVDGVFEETLPNTATITQTGQQATALIEILCYGPGSANVSKTTLDGPADIGALPFSFDLANPAGTVVETVVLNGPGGVAFATDLDHEGTWTVTEAAIAGWVTDQATCAFEVSFPGSSGQEHTCSFDNVEMGGIELMKLVNGNDPGDSAWSFRVMAGPDGADGEVLAWSTTPGGDTDGDGYLDFALALDSEQTWTVCEDGSPAGWTSVWSVDTNVDGVPDTTIVAYNPDLDLVPPADLGTRCVDFGAGTALPVPIGDRLAFQVDNTSPPPMGGPRTPGYWQAWSRCTPGNQVATAEANGGSEAGFWLLDDLLPITWAGDVAGGYTLTIETCEQGVATLTHRDWSTDGVLASDPAYKLARSLLAYQLNQGAGACLPTEPVVDGANLTTVQDLAAEAEALLVALQFDGTGRIFQQGRRGRTPDAVRATELAALLDAYNNGAYCGDEV